MSHYSTRPPLDPPFDSVDQSLESGGGTSLTFVTPSHLNSASATLILHTCLRGCTLHTTAFFVKMVVLAALAGLLLVLTVEAKIGNSDLPTSFCTESKECLLYDLVCESDGYEVRHYEPAKWVTTEQKSYIMEIAITTAFGRLFKYITGSNEAGIDIDMTGPVIIKIDESDSVFKPSTYTMSFLLPTAHQSSPPEPVDQTVYLTDMPDMKVYVRRYGGWMLFISDKLHAHLLSKKLESVGAAYDKNSHYAVGYDSPRKIMNRHNEVWYVAEGEPVCPAPEDPPSS